MEQTPEPVPQRADELLARIHDRLDTFQRTQDASVIASAGATNEAQELWQATLGQHQSGPVAVVHALALLSAYRHTVLPAGPGRLELQRAIALYGLLNENHPDLVPPQVKPLLPGGDVQSGDDLNAMLSYANQLLSPPAGKPALPDLDQAIDILHRAAEKVPDGRLRDSVLSSLSTGLTYRFEAAGDLASLDEAIEIGQELISAAGQDHEALPLYYSNLGVALRNRFHRTGDVGDLDDAVRSGEAAVAMAQDVNEQAMYLSMTSLTLRARGTRNDSVADLNLAVSAARSALENTPLHSPPYAIRISNYASILKSRYDTKGDPSDLDEAVTTARHWLDQLQPGQPVRCDALELLAQALGGRFEVTLAPRDLEDAVSACRGALSERRSVDTLYQLERLLRERFQRYGDSADIDGAIAAGQEALQILPDASPVRPGLLSHLCSSYRLRFHLTRDPADINAAINAGRLSAAIPASRQSDDLSQLNNLAGALRAGYQHARDSRLLDEAIETVRQVIARAPSHDPYLPARMDNLAALLVERWSATGNSSDLDEALVAAQSAAGHAAAARIPGSHRNQLGIVHHLRFQTYGLEDDAHAALDCWRATATGLALPAEIRLRAARDWAELAADLGTWDQAVDGYLTAAEVLPVTIWRGLVRADRERLLEAQGRHLGSDAAAAALNAGLAGAAIELLEQGRGVLWTQMLDDRDEFSRLSNVRNDIAEALVRVATQMKESE